MQYVGFIRGINVGGKQMKMEVLREMLQSLGYTNVKTILASGNVLFTAQEQDMVKLKATIEAGIQKTFHYTASVLLRTMDQIQELAGAAPFKGIEVKKETRLYVTFLGEPSRSSLPIPYTSEDGNFKILRVTDSETCSVLTLTPDRGTVDVMAVLEKEYGKNVTTRNWNTIEKIIKAAG